MNPVMMSRRPDGVSTGNSLERSCRWAGPQQEACLQAVHPENALLALTQSVLFQNGVVECRRIFCPPANCSQDWLPVHVDGICCKKCRRE